MAGAGRTREHGVAQVRLEEEQGLTFQGLVSLGKEVSLSGGHWDAVVASSGRRSGRGDMIRFALWRGAEEGQNGWRPDCYGVFCG